MQFNYIANATVVSSSGRTMVMPDPSDGQPYGEIQPSNTTDIDQAVRGTASVPGVRLVPTGAADRGRLRMSMNLSLKIAEHAEELTAIDQRDCGKPTRQARADAVALAR